MSENPLPQADPAAPPPGATPGGAGQNIIFGDAAHIGGSVIAGGVTYGYTAAQVSALLNDAIAAARDQTAIAPTTTFDELAAHYITIAKAFSDGRAVPFLGVDVNLCGRPAGAQWHTQHYLPSISELAEYLADNFGYPDPNRRDLIRVAQYVAVMNGDGPLYDNLRALFNIDYTPTALHQLFALAPAVLRAKGYLQPNLLIITTNFDDSLEHTFKSVGEPYDLVTYIADKERRGKFMHWPHGGEPRLIDQPNKYDELPIDLPSCRLRRSIILKLHGAMDRADAEKDSYVITEDHYIDYMLHDSSNSIPAPLAVKLKKSNFLFMGYSLRDWNLRVILQRIWGMQQRGYNSWAVQPNPEALEKKFWGKRNVDILNVRLEDYVAQLTLRLRELPLVEAKP